MLSTSLFLVFVYGKQIVYLFYSLVCIVVLHLAVKGIRALEKEHNRMMNEKCMADYRARGCTVESTYQM
jgi:hypothetical protein